MSTTTQDEYTAIATHGARVPAAVTATTTCRCRRAASNPEPSLLTTFIVFAVLICFLIQSSSAIPVPTSTMKCATAVAALGVKFLYDPGQDQLRRRNEDNTATQSLEASAIIGIVFGVIFSVVLVIILSWVFDLCCICTGCRRSEPEEIRRTRAETNEEVSRVIARELRRDNIGRSGIPNTNITFVEMQRGREPYPGAGGTIPHLAPMVYPQVQPFTRPRPPPAYFSQDGPPPYAGISRQGQMPGSW